MTEPTLYVVTTDFDFDDIQHSLTWDEENRRRSPTEIMERHRERYSRIYGTRKRYSQIRTCDILGCDYNMEGLALQRRLKQVNLFPCIEMRPDHMNLKFTSFFSLEGITPSDYKTLAQLIRLINPDSGQRIKERRIEGRSHIDVVVNYYSNEGKYDGIIQQLKDEFSVQELSVRRERFNILDEGYTDEELAERYKE